MCNYAFKFVQDDQQAQDVVQDVFMNFWRKKDSLNIDLKVKSYLFTAVRNKALEVLRHKKMKANHYDAVRINELLRYDIEDEAEKYVRLEKIHVAIGGLPTKCREVFSLSKMNGLSYNEIAAHLGISVKTVENQIVRALKLLREKLN